MTEQMFFNARDLFHTIEHDIVDGAEHKMIFAGLYRARFDLRANAAISPVKTELNMPRAPLRITMKANATVVAA